MKYLVSFVFGLLVGAVLAALGLYHNPFTATRSLTPLDVSAGEILILNFSRVADDLLVVSNDGERAVSPRPPAVQQLWEPAVRQTALTIAPLSDARGNEVGVGIEFESRSESTRLWAGEALVDSIWHVVLPGRGSLVVAQQENYWDFLRDVVVPAYRSSADSWRGTWYGNTTSGPGALGTATVVGGSGEFADLATEAVESLSATAYTLTDGPQAMQGRLTLRLPEVGSAAADP